ncbi:MAG: corrinoid protein [Chloroflexi bacterium]|nr:corrinoid protein [Chloroflexota bacterium]
MSRQEEILDGLYDHTLDGEAKPVKALTQEGLELGMDPLVLLFDALIPALEEVGRLFEQGEYFVPEMLIAARAMQGAMEILKSLLLSNSKIQIGTYVMGTVKGDIHDIGKNLCNIMPEGAGFKVVDLGVNCPPEKYVAAAIEYKAELVGTNAFLTTMMPMFKKNIEAFKEAGLRDKVKIMVGGAPVTQEYCDVVGADGYVPDASSCVRLAKQLLAELKERQLV